MTFTSRVLALVTLFFALAFGQEELSSNNVTNPEYYLNVSVPRWICALGT
jgi:hypothetical protein